MHLFKHAAGTPLSSAEREQRRRAARARWAARSGRAAATLAGGTVAGVAASAGVGRVIQRQRQAISAARRKHIIPAVVRNIERQNRFAARYAAAQRNLRGKNTVPASLRAMSSQLRTQRVSGERAVSAIAANPQFMPEAGQFESADAAASDLAEQLAPAAAEIADLRANFRQPRKTVVEGSTATVAAQPRRRGRKKTIDRPQTKTPNPRALTPELRQGLIAEMEAQMRRATDPAEADRIAYELDRLSRPLSGKAGRGQMTVRGEGHAVREHVRETGTHIRRVPGYPDAKGLAQLRARVTNLLEDKAIGFETAEAIRRTERLAGAKAAARAELGPVLGRVQFLRRSRIGLIAMAAGLGGAATLGLVHRLSKLSPDALQSVAEDPSALAKSRRPSARERIAANLARTYRAWIDRLLGRGEQRIDMTNDVGDALAAPIMQAFTAGAMQRPVDAGDPSKYHLDVNFDLLNPSVRRHMADYALDRIVEISSAQREAIRSTLMAQSVLQGIGPRDVARTIRQSIGLTTYQSGVVQAYRFELMRLDPKALERKLRDSRYDNTVRRAIETQTPLSEEQIDAMVDAYHRRMLALRAETIARTEAIRATSYGAVARAQDVLDQHPDLDVVKRWIATDDERTRDTHRDLDGKEVIGITTAFRTSAGNWLKWPIDADGAADECINCRCALGFRFIPRHGTQGLQAVAV